MYKPRHFYRLSLALGSIGLAYAALEMDFSKLSVAGLWLLAGLGVLMVAGIYFLIVHTEDPGGGSDKKK